MKTVELRMAECNLTIDVFADVLRCLFKVKLCLQVVLLPPLTKSAVK